MKHLQRLVCSVVAAIGKYIPLHGGLLPRRIKCRDAAVFTAGAASALHLTDGFTCQVVTPHPGGRTAVGCKTLEYPSVNNETKYKYKNVNKLTKVTTW